MQIESIGWEFDVLQAQALDDRYPRIDAVFVGVTPAIAYDVHNQAKFSRPIEHHLKTLERQLRQQHQAALSTLGTADIAHNVTVIQDLIHDYRAQLTDQILVAHQLELESLTLAGEWPLFWDQATPLVAQKSREREPMPQLDPSTATNPDHPANGDDPYMPV